ncbi:MAG: pyridoxamine 5'-phosphate oxidase family protein [Acidimicrobiales bacterium]
MEILSRPDCLMLLATRPVGRVSVIRYGTPVILPVTYCLLGEDVVFATGTGSKSLAVTHGDAIAFEVDDIDSVTRSGWSVLAVGTACRLVESDRDWDAARALDLYPWVGRHAVRLIRMPTDRLSGRRLLGDLATGPGPSGTAGPVATETS